jgi:hypothetical protein
VVDENTILHLTRLHGNEFRTIIKKCEDENIDANLKIRKLSNVFLNAQQMSAQLATYIILSLPLYHACRSFSFLNTSLQLECAFVFKSIKLLNEPPPNSIDIKAQSPIDKYLKRHETLHFLALREFVANYNLDEKKFKRREVPVVIQYVNYKKH